MITNDCCEYPFRELGEDASNEIGDDFLFALVVRKGGIVEQYFPSEEKRRVTNTKFCKEKITMPNISEETTNLPLVATISIPATDYLPDGDNSSPNPFNACNHIFAYRCHHVDGEPGCW